MRIADVCDNLAKLDMINDFISIVEIKFNENQTIINNIKIAKKAINQCISDFLLAIDIDYGFTINRNIIGNIELLLRIFDDELFIQKISNFDLFIIDLKSLKTFFDEIKNYKKPLFLEGDAKEIASFNEKKLSILAKKFN